MSVATTPKPLTEQAAFTFDPMVRVRDAPIPVLDIDTFVFVLQWNL